jgi:hypothetical protein
MAAVTGHENMTAEEVQRAYNNEVQDVPKFSGRMSDLCKYIWAGSMATLFALLTHPTERWSFWAAVAGALAFILDYLQNAAA